MSAGRLFLIPWHIGDALDTTFRAAALARRLDVFLVEDAEDARFQLGLFLGEKARGKTLLEIPEAADQDFLRRVLAELARGDAGMLSSGGAPAFVDPGAWVVAELRRRGVELRALAGPSCLTTMLALSGVEWRRERDGVFSFAFFADGPLGGSEERAFLRAAARPEALFVFLRPQSLRRCLSLLRTAAGPRPVTLFFDLTKPRRRFPLADRALTRTSAEWLEALPGLPWDKISDVALMVGP